MYNSRIAVSIGEVANPSDTKLTPDFQLMYNAVHQLRRAIEAYAGITIYAATEQPSIAETLVVGNPSRVFLVAGEALVANQIVSIDAAGTVFKANATSGAVRTSHGFVTKSYAAGAIVEVTLFGAHFGIAGLTPGTWYYQSATPGVISNGISGPAGTLKQTVGYAISATVLMFIPGTPTYL